ncbi:MAG: ABC transporter substrate-binding protein [Clostridiaceae bacterium]|nr:ABC transporter substrate-binding protein [Clostridiaceae bacterium]
MKQKKTWIILISLVLVLALFTGCAKTEGPAETTPGETDPDPVITEPSQAPEDPSITVTDMAGREITLKEPASRVVALTAADCEILFAIGAGDTLVGRGEYCDYPAQVLELPAVQSGLETNLEQIIDLDPQVLLMSTMAQTEEQVAALEAAGIQVVVSDADDIEGVYIAIRLIGKIMGKDQEAEEVISSMKETFEAVAKEAASLSGRSIYFEVSPLEWGLWTAGQGTFMDEIARMIGLDNAFGDVEGWGEISEEAVLERNPDYILTISMYFGTGPDPVEEILGRPGWQSIRAVQTGSILNLPDNELSRPGPRLADGAKMLFDFILDQEAALDEAA